MVLDGRAGRLVRFSAVLTVEARVGHPLDTDSVTNLEVGVGVVSDGGDVASTLVSSDKLRIGVVRRGQSE